MANKIKSRMIDQDMTLDDLRKETELTLRRLKEIIEDGAEADHWDAGSIALALDCEPTDIFTTDCAGAWYVRSKGGPF